MSGLYIHIPFCHSKCYYCDFCSRPPKDGAMIDAYIDRVVQEIAARFTEAPETIYLGGGTPSLLTIEQLSRILAGIHLDRCRELTIEANPEDVTPEWVGSVKELGINRISMGVQSLDDRELKAIGRRQSASEALSAVNKIREGGISNISLDLIYGLPGQSPDSWKRSLDTILQLRPSHLSCYHLSYEPGTRLYARREKGLVKEADEDTSALAYQYLCCAAAEAGYEHYEISNFSLPGMRSLHNSSYWCGIPYVGIGPGAHSFDGINRCFHTSDILKYLREGYVSTLTVDPEDRNDRLNDYIMTRLRTSDGLSLEDMRYKYSLQDADNLLRSARHHLSRGSLRRDGNTLTIPEEKWLVSDSIIVDLFV